MTEERKWEETFKEIDCCQRGCEHSETLGERALEEVKDHIKELRAKDKERLLEGVEKMKLTPHKEASDELYNEILLYNKALEDVKITINKIYE